MKLTQRTLAHTSRGGREISALEEESVRLFGVEPRAPSNSAALLQALSERRLFLQPAEALRRSIESDPMNRRFPC